MNGNVLIKDWIVITTFSLVNNFRVVDPIIAPPVCSKWQNIGRFQASFVGSPLVGREEVRLLKTKNRLTDK